jgi:uncharacterized membrane protein YhhN
MIIIRFIKSPALLFITALAIDVVALMIGFQGMHTLVKPLLMPLLMLFVWNQRSKSPKPIIRCLFIGLLFAWFGDIFLLFENKWPVFFMAGLGSFLCTHIFYILMFLKINQAYPMPGKKHWFFWGIIAAYGLFLLNLVWPSLGELKIPVLIYAFCICLMAVVSINTPTIIPALSKILLVSGALLFVVSDSILAVNKFLQAGAWAPPAIMLTYGLAQFAIAAGASNLPKAASGEALAPAV